MVTPPAEADDHVSEIASSKSPVNLEVLTLKCSAPLAQLLLEKVDLEASPDGSHPHTVF